MLITTLEAESNVVHVYCVMVQTSSTGTAYEGLINYCCKQQTFDGIIVADTVKCKMGCKMTLDEDKGRIKFLKRKKHDDSKKAKPAKPCSCSSVLSPQQEPAGSRCKEILVEFLCSCCMLCVCCPLAVICCCIKLPCRICQKAIKDAWKWACYGSKSRIFADEYSSFSDIDSDVTSGKVKPSVSENRKDRFHHSSLILTSKRRI